MTLPGETEAGSAGMQPCRGITWWAHRDDDRQRRIERPNALKIPARKGGILTNGERILSVQAEPSHPKECRTEPVIILRSESSRQSAGAADARQAYRRFTD
jgi:hypothetical protein